jgi:hypothetical protein
MRNCKSDMTPFLSRFKLGDGGDTSLVDKHTVQKTSGELVVSHTLQTIPLLCNWHGFQVHARAENHIL